MKNWNLCQVFNLKLLTFIFKSSNSLKKVWLLLLATALSFSAFSQSAGSQLQVEVNEAIKKAYPASVRMWGFDVEKNERTSAQFSGVVVSKDGLILTAAHTVTPGRTYKVFFTDGRTSMAKALGRIDLAKTPGTPDAGMLQMMESGPFPFAEIGSSDDLMETTSCISISYPEKLNQQLPTLRYGQIVVPKNEYGFIQSSCKMEPGDSGGPLFDLAGKVIGIHSAIDVDEAKNFEIPIQVYRKYWTALHLAQNYTEYPMADPVAAPQMAVRKAVAPLRFDKKIMALRKHVRTIQTIVDGKKNNSEVTLVNFKDAQGKTTQWMIGKSSLLGDSLSLPGDAQTKIEVVARDRPNDLVVLKSSTKEKGGFKLTRGKFEKPVIGSFVTSLFTDGKFENSVVGGTEIALPKSISIPYLGISVLFKSKPASVSVVKPGSAAAVAGIKTGDVILSINGIALQQASDFAPLMTKFWAGEKMKVVWLSEGKEQQQVIQSVDRPFTPSNHPVDRFAGGSSARRDGFDRVFVHDAVILPSQCGAPIVDLQGNLVGINIARFSRAVTLGLPLSVILNFLERTTAIHE